MEENNELDMSKERQYIKYIVVTILMIVWVFGIGGLNAKIAENFKKSCEPKEIEVQTNPEIEVFNSTFSTYEGIQTGSQVKALLQRLIANANTYRDDPSKIPCISYNSTTNEKNSKEKSYAYGVIEENKTNAYVKYINIISKVLDLKHTYNVVLTINNLGYVAGITINYDEDNLASNFIVAQETTEVNIVNGLKGVSELIDGEIKSDDDECLNNIINDNTNATLNTDTETIKSQDIFIRHGSDSWDKPIIYLYPEEETSVNVSLGNPDLLTCTYPQYDENKGWNVVAEPNGDLRYEDRNLYALYWEGISKNKKEIGTDGFIVKGEDTSKVLEEKLSILGLTDREAEEFIVYWLPRMEKNNYNYIRFETMDEIEENMPLNITPKPDTIIRVLMDWCEIKETSEVENLKKTLKEQILTKVERSGYVAVEWGGSEIK